MSRRLKAEIEKVEQEINVLAQVKARVAHGDTPETIDAELAVLEQVRTRLLAALPAATSEPKTERKKRAPKGLPKPNGKAKEATA